jgi:hypothetical protein
VRRLEQRQQRVAVPAVGRVQSGQRRELLDDCDLRRRRISRDAEVAEQRQLQQRRQVQIWGARADMQMLRAKIARLACSLQPLRRRSVGWWLAEKDCDTMAGVLGRICPRTRIQKQARGVRKSGARSTHVRRLKWRRQCARRRWRPV